MERHSFLIVSGDSPKTMRKLCLSTKFTHHGIRWNYSILRSDLIKEIRDIKDIVRTSWSQVLKKELLRYVFFKKAGPITNSIADNFLWFESFRAPVSYSQQKEFANMMLQRKKSNSTVIFEILLKKVTSIKKWGECWWIFRCSFHFLYIK